MSAKKKKGNNHINVLSRQQELITLLGSGLSLTEISNKLKCSIQTIYKDKQEIQKQGLKDLRSLGSENLAFYFFTIINSMNRVKKFNWSVLESGPTQKGSMNITIKDKILASKVILECDNSLREIYKDTMATIVIAEYKEQLESIKAQLKQETFNDTPNNETINYFTPQLPRLKQDNTTIQQQDNNNMNNDNVNEDNKNID